MSCVKCRLQCTYKEKRTTGGTDVTVGELKIKLSADTGEFDKSMNLAKEALKNMEKGQTGTANGAKIVSDIADSIISQSPKMMQAGAELFGAVDDGVPAVTGEIKESVSAMMAEVLADVSGYASGMESAGRMLGDSLASGISQSLSKVEIASKGLYAAAMGSHSTSSTYNTYHTTYNAAQSQTDGVNIADFENRIRRAYA